MFLTKAVIENTSLLSDWRSETPDHKIGLVDIAAAIMHHIAQLISNAHAITEITYEGNSLNFYHSN